MKKKTGIAPKRQQTKRTPKGMQGFAKSFLNVGIPVVMETPLTTNYRGISARLIENGNTPVCIDKQSFKIKL